jgi:hypothetical protein
LSASKRPCSPEGLGSASYRGTNSAWGPRMRSPRGGVRTGRHGAPQGGGTARQRKGGWGARHQATEARPRSSTAAGRAHCGPSASWSAATRVWQARPQAGLKRLQAQAFVAYPLQTGARAMAAPRGRGDAPRHAAPLPRGTRRPVPQLTLAAPPAAPQVVLPVPWLQALLRGAVAPEGALPRAAGRARERPRARPRDRAVPLPKVRQGSQARQAPRGLRRRPHRAAAGVQALALGE